MKTRRAFLNDTALIGVAAFAGALHPPFARAAAPRARALSGNRFDLGISAERIAVDGKISGATLVNQSFPGPLLRWREGEAVTLNVSNGLSEDTSIHWHGILLPAGMDGVPGISFPGIRPGETFQYRFPVKQAGTYWYHSHSGFQEQAGLYGAIIIEPAIPDPVRFDREHVIVLGDWTYMKPANLFRKLKKSSEVFNYQHRTLGDFFADIRDKGADDAFSRREMWGAMRMDPTDIADVTGAAYSYVANGRGPDDNWTGLFESGESVRLRFVNASAMTIFNVRIPGLPLTIVAADGQNVSPVETDEFQIGVAETYDVIVAPEKGAYTIFAETIDRSGFARATLAEAPGMTAAIPALRPRPTLTMKDMAMNHGAMSHGAMDHGSMNPGAMDHSQMQDHSAANVEKPVVKRGVGVDMLAVAPSTRLSERGTGLSGVPHRVLTYAQLSSLAPNPDLRAPDRDIEIHLTGNMARYMWSFDGVKFSEVTEPINFHHGQRVRVTLVNDTMMNHPIHLHGMFFDLVTGEHANKPRKHTVIVKPGDKVSFDVTADAPGEWAFHCHLLYHMMAGMMQTVKIDPMVMMDPASPMKMDHHDGHHGVHSSAAANKDANG